MELHPDHPVVTGLYRMTDEWTIDLPARFNRRFEDGSLVIWRPGLTFWISIWGGSGVAPEARLQSILAEANPARRLEQIERSGDLIRLTYELPEEDESRAQRRYTSISGYVIGPGGHVQISAYFDDDKARSLGYQAIHSVNMIA